MNKEETEWYIRDREEALQELEEALCEEDTTTDAIEKVKEQTRVFYP